METSDVSLCVLSLPEVMVETSAGLRIEIPLSLKPLITHKTLFLLNKIDLIPPAKADQLSSFTGPCPAWKASLSSGEGMSSFLSGFAQTLDDR